MNIFIIWSGPCQLGWVFVCGLLLHKNQEYDVNVKCICDKLETFLTVWDT